MIKEIIKLLIYPILDIIYLLTALIPKNKRKWVFGSWFGKRYADNSKYLFEYVCQSHPEIRAIWISRNRKVINNLRSNRLEAYYSFSPQGIFHIVTAGVAVMSSGKKDLLNFLLSPTHFKVQLWHGVGYKKIMYDDRITGNLHKPFTRLKHLLFPFLRPRYDMVIATSREIQRQFCGAFLLPPKKVPITGYPRNDIFFKNTPKQIKSNKQILYAPTHRREGRGKPIQKILPDSEMLWHMNEEFNRLKVQFYLKLHFYDEKYLPSLERYSHISPAPEIDIQELLLQTDILITDYSSIYIDFLLLDRPIIFTPFDIEDYLRQDRKFYLPYQEVTPGPIARNWNEVLSYIEEALQDPEKYREERHRIRDFFHQYKDGNSSQRVFNEIIYRIFKITATYPSFQPVQNLAT